MSNNFLSELKSSLSIKQLQEVSGLPSEVFNELKDLGVFDEFSTEDGYVSRSVVVVRKAARLRKTFHLDTTSLALIIHFIGESDQLQREIRKIYKMNPYL